MRVEIDPPNPDRALVPGMYVQSKFKFKGAPGFRVPAALLFLSSGPQVAVVDGNGAVAFRDVAIADDDGDLVSLTSGLHAGEGEGEARERGVVGETPNLAVRLQAIAKPGGIVVAESAVLARDRPVH
jgi:hypothetical protein